MTLQFCLITLACLNKGDGRRKMELHTLHTHNPRAWGPLPWIPASSIDDRKEVILFFIAGSIKPRLECLLCCVVVVWRWTFEAYIFFGCLKYVRARRMRKEWWMMIHWFYLSSFIRELTINMERNLSFAYAVTENSPICIWNASLLRKSFAATRINCIFQWFFLL